LLARLRAEAEQIRAIMQQIQAQQGYGQGQPPRW
jgi:hypothetical protein